MSSDEPTRREFLKTTGLGAAAITLTGAVQGADTPAKRPNVLLYVVDDQGMDDAGCYGNPVIKTPALDLLAAEGTRFTQSFCTTASCSASRSVILTGLYNHKNGQYGHEHAYHHFSSFPDIHSLPAMLAAAGYRTASAGKFHVAPESVYHFGEYLKGPSPETMADHCRAFIENDSNEPFFLYFCTTEPHRPFHRDGSDTFAPADVVVPSYLPDSPECREELAQYYGSVQRTDRGLMRLIDILKETGKWDDTLIVFISDNGIAFPGAKTTAYEPGLRLPCVVRNPYAEKRGVVTDAMVTWADLTPTILDFANAAPADAAFHGRSFRSVLDAAHTDGWDEVYMSHTFHEIQMYYPMRVVRERRFKLIWNIASGLPYPFASDLWESKTWRGVVERGDTHYGKRTVDAYLHRPAFELYDLDNDPDEVRNLADDPAYAGELARLQEKLKAFQQRTEDPWILKWEYE